MNMGIRLSIGPKLEQRVSEPHSPIENPQLTQEAEWAEADLDSVLARGVLSGHDKMLQTEAFLLSRWEEGEQWRKYLDSPLIAHVDAALQLRRKYDAVVGIKEAGIPYANIFGMVDFPTFVIDYSHHKRGMQEPKMDDGQLKQLRDKQSVLVVDVDFISGKTLREVARYLRENDVNVQGAYMGLSRWPGIKTDDFTIGDHTIDFDTFWVGGSSGLGNIRNNAPYQNGLIPRDLVLYAPNSTLVNPTLVNSESVGSAAARRIASYFVGKAQSSQQNA